jgi:hypothetical protein
LLWQGLTRAQDRASYYKGLYKNTSTTALSKDGHSINETGKKTGVDHETGQSGQKFALLNTPFISKALLRLPLEDLPVRMNDRYKNDASISQATLHELYDSLSPELAELLAKGDAKFIKEVTYQAHTLKFT